VVGTRADPRRWLGALTPLDQCGSFEGMGSLIKRNEHISRRKGWIAAAAAGGSLAMLTAVPFLGVLGLVGSAYLGWDWFSFRAKNGMRF
jgi:hypothetical protein